MMPRHEDTKTNVLMRFLQLQVTHPSYLKFWDLAENINRDAHSPSSQLQAALEAHSPTFTHLGIWKSPKLSGVLKWGKYSCS